MSFRAVLEPKVEYVPVAQSSLEVDSQVGLCGRFQGAADRPELPETRRFRDGSHADLLRSAAQPRATRLKVRSTSGGSLGWPARAAAPLQRAIATAVVRDQRAWAVVRCQGWMRHWNLCVPPASGPVVRLPPGGTPVVWKMSPIAHSGTGSRPSNSLSSATQPPPNAATSLNVWNSPPRLEAMIVPPAFSFSCPGANRHAGASPIVISWPMNSSNVTPPSLTQAPSPSTALKVSASQSSSICTLRWLAPAHAAAASMSVARIAPTAETTATPLVRISAPIRVLRTQGDMRGPFLMGCPEPLPSRTARQAPRRRTTLFVRP